MSSPPLTMTSYLVLGLVAQAGPMTPYEMKQKVASSIGYFWSFPHSQLYAEPDRLARAGHLAVEIEEAGRRRKRYSITREGSDALLAWLRSPDQESWEIRDPGLLKLFFLGLADLEDVVAHAKREAETHRRRIEEYELVEALASGEPSLAHAMATLDLGKRVSRAYLAFWEELAENPPPV